MNPVTQFAQFKTPDVRHVCVHVVGSAVTLAGLCSLDPQVSIQSKSWWRGALVQINSVHEVLFLGAQPTCTKECRWELLATFHDSVLSMTVWNPDLRAFYIRLISHDVVEQLCLRYHKHLRLHTANDNPGSVECLGKQYRMAACC